MGRPLVRITARRRLFGQGLEPLTKQLTGGFKLIYLLLLAGDDLVELLQGKFLIGHFGFELVEAFFVHGPRSEEMVGARGFEPPTTATPLRCATRLRYAPMSC